MSYHARIHAYILRIISHPLSISLTFIPVLTCSLNEEPLRPVRIAVAGVVATIAKVEVRPSTIH